MTYESGFMGTRTLPDARPLRMHLEIEIECERFDRTLPGAMFDRAWRVHPAYRSKSERYARATAKRVRDQLRDVYDDWWTTEEDRRARDRVAAMTLEEMEREFSALKKEGQ